MVYHPSRRYRLSEAEKDEVYAGRAVWIRGNVLAASEAICRATPDEVMFYFTAREDQPELITGLIIPDQHTSGVSCCAEGEALIAVGRRARAQGRVVVSASHSHGQGGLVFTSTLDWSLMDSLLAERVGVSQWCQTSDRGVVREVDD